jgi:hypothetical protein
MSWSDAFAGVSVTGLLIMVFVGLSEVLVMNTTPEIRSGIAGIGVLMFIIAGVLLIFAEEA